MVISCILQQDFLETSESPGLAGERGLNNRRKKLKLNPKKAGEDVALSQDFFDP